MARTIIKKIGKKKMINLQSNMVKVYKKNKIVNFQKLKLLFY